MSIERVFDRTAHEYDNLRRKFIPCFEDFHRTAMTLLPHPSNRRETVRVLDLGAGTGLLSEMVLDALPQAHVTLVDLAPGMLEQAKKRLEGRMGRVTILQGDYLAMDLPGPFQAIVSALSIHHLEDPEKRRLFVKAFGLLDKGGVFINADQVLGRTAWSQEFNHGLWLKQVADAGITDREMTEARARMAYDRLAPLKEQMAWLEEAGFTDVDCYYKYFSFVVYSGRKP